MGRTQRAASTSGGSALSRRASAVRTPSRRSGGTVTATTRLMRMSSLPP
jgi:hypothetical protein